MTYPPTERQRRISIIARRIWESEGRPDDQALRHWLMAEKLVLAQEQAGMEGGEDDAEDSRDGG